MSFAPYAVMWVAWLAASGVNLMAGRRPRLSVATSLAASLSALILWFVFRPEVVVPALSIAGRQWVIGQTTWQLTGVVLLLALTAIVYAIFNDESQHTNVSLAAISTLTAAAVPAIWAGDDRTRLLGITLFVAGWAAAVWFARASHEEAGSIDWRSPVQLLAALFPLWLAAALPQARTPLALLAAVMLVGVWPFDRWRGNIGINPAASLPLNGLPVVVGAAVFASAIETALPTGITLAATTALGLLSMVVGFTRAWGLTMGNLAQALSGALVGLALTAAVWAGEAALVAAARVAVFVPALLILGSTHAGQNPFAVGERETASGSRLTPLNVGLAAAFLVVAGLPLTAGFGVLSPLYEAWNSPGGWILLSTLVLTIALGLAAIYLHSGALLPGSGGRTAWLRAGAVFLPIVGLIQINTSLLDVGLLTWVAIILSPTIGLLLGRFAPNLEAVDELLRESVTWPSSVASVATRVRSFGWLAMDAIAEALSILNGDYGLLWLLGILLLLLWIA